ncbi:MAG: o-succinylbenzoate synthase [Calditrichia bacterium]|nr:o-succinylbenzoate synthase [Calditrichia bacterium]
MAKSIQITGFQIIPYSIPFKKPLQIGKNKIDTRNVFIFKLTSSDNKTGYGEAAPLPGFTKENLEDVKNQLFKIQSIISKKKIIIEDDFFSLNFENLFSFPNILPSVAYGLETAIINLMRKHPIAYFNDNNKVTSGNIEINALLHTNLVDMEKNIKNIISSGFRTIKIKVGRNKIEDDIVLLNSINKIINREIKLRVDANRLWDYSQALQFLNSINTSQIEYIEEPLADTAEFSKLYEKTGVSIALDETLQNLNINELTGAELKGIDAFILKPTILGGINKTIKLINFAEEHKIKPVLSSSFECGPGFIMLLKLASFITQKTACGLDTIKYFSNSPLSDILEIKNGHLNFLKTDIDDYSFIENSNIVRKI